MLTLTLSPLSGSYTEILIYNLTTPTNRVMLRYIFPKSFFKADMCNVQVPVIVITPPEREERSRYFSPPTSFNDEPNCKHPINVTSTLTVYRRSIAERSSLPPMPQVLRPSEPTQSVVSIQHVQVSISPRIRVLNTARYIRTILKRTHTTIGDRLSCESDKASCVPDENLKRDFERYMNSMHRNYQSRRKTPVPLSIRPVGDGPKLDGSRSQPSLEPSALLEIGIEAPALGDKSFLWDDNLSDPPLFTTPVYDSPAKDSPSIISPGRWEPKTVVIDVQKASNPPPSVSPFRYCAMMMNAEVMAVMNGTTVVYDEDGDDLENSSQSDKSEKDM